MSNRDKCREMDTETKKHNDEATLNNGDEAIATQNQKPECHDYGFPFEPYDIQRRLMKVAYDSYEGSKFALLESPTGTGKSLSLICSSLTWLRDHQNKTREQLEKKRDEFSDKIEQLKREEAETGDWLSAQSRRQEISRNLADVNKQLERLENFVQLSEARRHAKLHGHSMENYVTLASKTKDSGSPSKSVENALNESKDNIIGGSQASNQSDQNQGEEEDMEKKVAKQDEDYVKPKIYYASRTHSQLSQFVNEIKRTKFADINQGLSIKVASLASRANLCVNPEVLKLKDSSAINERCMEMQKETKPENRCSYIKAKQVDKLKDQILTIVHDIEDLVSRGRAMGSCPYYASRMAIPEAELVVLPYNNLLHRETREASSLDLKDNIVIVDEAHNILETICSIHSTPITGAQLIGCHTIFSRYYQKYKSRLSPRNATMIKTIVQCLTALIRYLESPSKHIRDYENPKSVDLNESNISIGQPTESNRTSSNGDGSMSNKLPPKHEDFMVDVNKFIGAANIERFNVFKMIDFFNRSQLARKLLGFFRQDNTLDFIIELYEPEGGAKDDQAAGKKRGSDVQPPKSKRNKSGSTKAAGGEEGGNVLSSTTSAPNPWELTSLKFIERNLPLRCKQNEIISAYPVYSLIEFLRSLTNASEDGKILTDFYANDVFKSSLKFVLLNPSSQFKQMTQEARSIVLAGGTMQPFDEFRELLFCPLGVDETRLTLFSCGHVINADNLCVATVATGPSSKPLELSYRVRSSFENLDELGRAIMEIALVVPGGMVCFLPSYEYEQLCHARWTKMGFISRIETRAKHVLREPRQTSHLKPVLNEFARTIEKGRSNGRGALLTCVVGGKMSEGINFNDDLGRCVVMVGLPYANIKSSELQQKMSYYDRTCKGSGAGPSAGQKYYENLCLKGINQSIGRAIRHKNDYAAIILLDRRYSAKTSIKAGLPGWMRDSLIEHERFEPLSHQLKSFFDRIKSRRP